MNFSLHHMIFTEEYITKPRYSISMQLKPSFITFQTKTIFTNFFNAFLFNKYAIHPIHQ